MVGCGKIGGVGGVEQKAPNRSHSNNTAPSEEANKKLKVFKNKGFRRWRRIRDSQLQAAELSVFQRKSSYRPTALPLKLPLFSACREDLQAGVSGLTSVLWISRLRHVPDLMGESTF